MKPLEYAETLRALIMYARAEGRVALVYFLEMALAEAAEPAGVKPERMRRVLN